MTTLLPTARILIQKSGDVPPTGEADFFILPIADQTMRKVGSDTKRGFGLVSSCSVEFSTTKEGPAIAVTFEVRNLHPKTIRQMAEAGYVKIEAGYIGHPSRQPQFIFFGRLDKIPVWYLDAGQLVWTFSALGFPNDVWAIRPYASSPVDSSGIPQRITVGEAIRIIADKIGIGRTNVRMPKIMDGDLSETDIDNRADLAPKVTDTFINAISLENWSTTGTAIEELALLLHRVTQAVQEAFGVVRRYSLLPDVNDPFIVVIEDLDRFSGESMRVNLDSSQVITAGPVETTATVRPTEVATEEADEAGEIEPQNTTLSIQEFQIVSVFDPKVAMGLLVEANSEKYDLSATFKVTKGKHILNGSPLRWRTEYGGQQQNKIEVARA